MDRNIRMEFSKNIDDFIYVNPDPIFSRRDTWKKYTRTSLPMLERLTIDNISIELLQPHRARITQPQPGVPRPCPS